MPKKITTEDFIKKAKEIHGYKYDYSKVEYINNSTKVCIICPTHGEFWQTPHYHLDGCGCQKCANKRRHRFNNLTLEEFIERARQVHGDKYDYSKVDYVNNHTKVCIICPTHGEFWQTPSIHLEKHGCPNCGIKSCGDKQRFSLEEFISKAKEIHGEKYDYSKVEYKGNKVKVCIICPTHGEFWQSPDEHLRGKGCKKCNKSSKLETLMKEKLILNEFEFKEQHHFNWLGLQSLDFYLQEYNVGIECQGIQHFKKGKSNKSYFTEEKIKLIQERDARKRQLCEEHGIKILYFSNLGIDYPYEVYEDIDELFKKIRGI